MTESTLPLAELLAKAGDGDFLCSLAEAVVQLLMEADVEGLIGAGRHVSTAAEISPEMAFEISPLRCGLVAGLS